MRFIHFVRLLFRHWPGKLSFCTAAALAWNVARTYG